MTQLLLHAPAYGAVADRIAALAPDLDIILMDNEGALTRDGAPLAAADARPEAAWFSESLYMSPVARTFAGVMLASDGLKWVQSAAAGFDNPVFARIVGKGAQLTTSHGQAVGMADYVLSGVLDVFRRGQEYRAAQADCAWRELQTREVKDTTWLLIGFGAIGQGVATRARAFGAKIVGVRRDQTPDMLADRIVPMADIPGLLPSTDVVVMSTPLNAATRHLANDAFFGAMKEGSVFVNVGRGGLVDEAALLAALERGAPIHAVLDVFETEPLPADSPFWRHPRVSVSPHCSGVTGGQTARNAALFVDNLGRFLSGAPLLNLINPKDVLGG